MNILIWYNYSGDYRDARALISGGLPFLSLHYFRVESLSGKSSVQAEVPEAGVGRGNSPVNNILIEGESFYFILLSSFICWFIQASSVPGSDRWVNHETHCTSHQ